MYTGVLVADLTDEEMKKAKKTVQIIVEHNGQKWVESYDGTKSLAVAVTDHESTTGVMNGLGGDCVAMIESLIEELPVHGLIILHMALTKRLKDMVTEKG